MSQSRMRGMIEPITYESEMIVSITYESEMIVSITYENEMIVSITYESEMMVPITYESEMIVPIISLQRLVPSWYQIRFLAAALGYGEALALCPAATAHQLDLSFLTPLSVSITASGKEN